jgi:ADP-ribose pyrophosphatase YjhB (NUDIX family)
MVVMASTAAPTRATAMAAAIPFRREAGRVRILLARGGDGRWALPTGRCDAEEPPHRTAEREAWRSARAAGSIGSTPIASYRFHERLGRGPRLAFDVRAFLLEVGEERPADPGLRTASWFAPSDAVRALRHGRPSAESAELTRALETAIAAIDGRPR